MKCITCGQEFDMIWPATNRKYCYDCKPAGDENKIPSVKRARRKAIKLALVNYKGGKCEICGYDKCLRALEFHHENPEEKDFILSSKNERPLEELFKEADKCRLLCANCHAEKHEELEDNKIK